MVELLTAGPVLPGGVREHYNVCGKAKCKCKDPVNPVKHGPYVMLSWTVSGKGSSLAIAPRDKVSVEKMVDRFRKLKTLLNELALEYAGELRNHSVNEVKRSVPVLAAGKTALQVSSSEACKLERSRARWKNKAVNRQAELEANRIHIRDLEASREKWRAEALALRRKNSELQGEAEAVKKVASGLADRVEALEQSVKKNGK